MDKPVIKITTTNDNSKINDHKMEAKEEYGQQKEPDEWVNGVYNRL